MKHFYSFVPYLALASVVSVDAAPGASSADISAASSAALASSDVSTPSLAAPQSSPTVELASDNPNGLLWTMNSPITPEAIRGSLGSNILGPQNVPVDLQNADFLAPPSTDAGTVYVLLD